VIKMKSSTFTFQDEIFVYNWEPDTEPKAVVQIIHGLAEHAMRYSRVAETLCKAGYICYANDARGHGRTAGDLTEATLAGNAGVLGPNGWKGVVNDVHELSNIIKKKHPSLPLFLIGHSWGAMLSQDYIQEWGHEINGCILSGTNGEVNVALLKEGKGVIEEEMKKRDPWCGFVSPASLWMEFGYGMEKIYDLKNEQKVPKDLPIFIIAGSLDPIGNNTIGLKALINRYEKYSITDVTFKFYEDARHEIFNEINREEVLRDIINWLNSHIH